MANESHFEKDFVIKYFVDHLGYESKSPNIFKGELMLVPSIVEDFLLEHNAEACKNVIRNDYQGNKKEFFKEIIAEISKNIFSSYNVGVELHPKRSGSFTFKNAQFHIYLPFTQKSLDKNVYTVIAQPHFSIPTINGRLSITPDIGVFINGLLVSFIQLKVEHRNQSAGEKGRNQILGDYFEAIQRCVVDVVKTTPRIYEDNTAKNALNVSVLKYFHSPLHMVAMDTSSAYVIRGIERYEAEIEKFYMTGKVSDNELKDSVRKSFFLDTVYTKEAHLTNIEKCQKTLYNLYAKENLRNEIMYFNFLGYEKLSSYENGKKTLKNKSNAALNYPRPNQKYGVDKAIKEVINKYENENNPEYELERIKQKLDMLGVSEEIKQKAIEKRKAYKNNKNQFSLLLQYAAGFGKTYILCWLALMLKDLQKSNTDKYLFDKIIMVSDRVDLRDQVDRAMSNMNIEKALFAEADTTEKLKEYLNGGVPRIIIVNIQKFPFLKNMVESEALALKNQRIAFLIDEIHRSNSGDQHGDMTSLFDDIVNIMDYRAGKKNLVIGLTATPTDENLARFGEYKSCIEHIKWAPFDTYTMKEAQEDGFVLNPLKALVPCAVELQYAEEDKNTFKIPSTKNKYEKKDRIEAIAKEIARILVNVTYRKIYGQGKAMLACYSIASAKAYYDAIRAELFILTQDPKYAKYAAAKVLMVYTNNQEDNPAHDICGYNSEKEVITAFKAEKNGLMIVVDKLQTGFDEPKLHTLFLDKEVKGINAVQTVCRVNRTFKNKEDCLVVDFSLDNINISNIQYAFEKYAGIVISELDSVSIKDQVERDYKNIVKTDYYREFYKDYQKSSKDTALMMKMSEWIKKLTVNEHAKKLGMRDCELYLNYIQKIGLIDSVIGLEDKYKEYLFIDFMKVYINIFKLEINAPVGTKEKEIIDFWLESIGMVESSQVMIDDMTKPSGVKDSKVRDSQSNSDGYDILAMIMELNKKEENKEKLMEEYHKKLLMFFTKMIEIDLEYNEERLMLKLQNIQQYGDEELEKEFKKIMNMTIRRIKRDEAVKDFVEMIKDHGDMLENDFVKYVSQ